MLSVDEALAKIVAAVQPLHPWRMALDDALGLVLAKTVTSNLDSPPFDKSLMDGFAVRAVDVSSGPATLRVIETITAGDVPTKTVESGTAARIMTGAPIPDGADAVVKVEETRFDEAAGAVEIETAGCEPGTNTIARGTSTRRGDVVVEAGRVLRPQELGALAELGDAKVFAHRRPRVAILATGDELVPVGETPGPGRIRNSNETMLVAQMRRAGAEAVPLGIAKDERSDLRERIERGLECDMLLLSGGVSAGTLDLVPSELAAAGVREVFHGVHVKPGKPVWFGMKEGEGDREPVCVFGLPGNPVSSMVCAELFARTALRRQMGWAEATPRVERATLLHDHRHRGNRPVYHPATIDQSTGRTTVQLVPWHGSSDLRATIEANGMALIPPESTLSFGTEIDTILWE